MSSDPQLDRIAELCDHLRREPVFQMSLHSKELFHSNMLAWFCETYPDAARQAFGGWVPRAETTAHQIQREHKNLDLVIQIPGLERIVIENKVFSPPDEAQLNRYSETRAKDLQSSTLLLLSLGRPSWNGGTFTDSSGRVWKYVSYRDLAKAMDDAVVSIPGFDGDLLRHYVSFISHLSDLADEISTRSSADAVFLHSSEAKILHEVRISDAVSKLRARSSIATIRERMMPLFDGARVEFKTDFSNGTPLLDGYVWLDNGDRVGWQYQGKQWRLAVWSAAHVGKADDLTKRRIDYVADRYAEWFDFTPIPNLIRRQVNKIPKNEAKGTFNSFKPEFVYRYRDIANLKMSELEILSRHYLDRARELFR